MFVSDKQFCGAIKILIISFIDFKEGSRAIIDQKDLCTEKDTER